MNFQDVLSRGDGRPAVIEVLFHAYCLLFGRNFSAFPKRGHCPFQLWHRCFICLSFIPLNQGPRVCSEMGFDAVLQSHSTKIAPPHFFFLHFFFLSLAYRQSLWA